MRGAGSMPAACAGAYSVIVIVIVRESSDPFGLLTDGAVEAFHRFGPVLPDFRQSSAGELT